MHLQTEILYKFNINTYANSTIMLKEEKRQKCYVVIIKVCQNNNILKMFSNMITDEESRKGYVYDIY